MKVAAYQSPLATCRSADALELIREQIERCESLGVEILCCPEAVLGGLADYADQPTTIALDVEGGQLNTLLRPLASETVTTILGFTEIGANGRLYNSAAVVQRGTIVGLYRKLNPAINRSVYTAGSAMPVFTVGALTFGIIICRDSTFSAPAADMVSRGAMALFVPTNNGLPSQKSNPRIAAEARACDVALATGHGVSVIRADVAGRTPVLISYGSSEIVNRDGTVLAAAGLLESDLIVADIETGPCC
jgi:5-aminopentanamidase